MGNEKFKYDIFLSHNSKDKPAVRKLAERLRRDGVQVWFDEWIIRTGDDIYLQIEKGLEESRVLILFMSPNTFGSDWVNLERSTSLFRDPANRQRRFVPLLLAGCEIPDVLRRYKYIDFRKKEESSYKDLLEACQAEQIVREFVEGVSNPVGQNDDQGRNLLERKYLPETNTSEDIKEILSIDPIKNIIKSAFLLESIYYYPEPKIIRKERKHFGPPPDNKLGWIQAGSKLMVIKSKEEWFEIQDTENEIVTGWILNGRNVVTSHDPRIYYTLETSSLNIKGYLVCNMYFDGSGGSIKYFEFIDDIEGRVRLNLDKCMNFSFHGKKINIIYERDKLSGKSAGGECFLFLNRKISLNQEGKVFNLKKIAE